MSKGPDSFSEADSHLAVCLFIDAWEAATDEDRKALPVWVVYRARFGETVLVPDSYEGEIYSMWLDPMAIREKKTGRDLVLTEKVWATSLPRIRPVAARLVRSEDLDLLMRLESVLSTQNSLRKGKRGKNGPKD